MSEPETAKSVAPPVEKTAFTDHARSLLLVDDDNLFRQRLARAMVLQIVLMVLAGARNGFAPLLFGG